MTSSKPKYEELVDMKLPNLQVHFQKVTGRKTGAPNKKYLAREIIAHMKKLPTHGRDTSPAS